LDYRDARGRGYSSAYQKAIHHQLSSVFNHACKYYRLKENPARLAGYMGKDDLREMHIWSTEEYKRFSQAIRNKPMSFYMFEVLFWTGMREGECLALTKADFDLEDHWVRISKSYHRLHGEDLITTPKTAKSNRTIRLPRFLSAELADYFSMIPDVPDTERIFPVTKNYLYHEMKRGCQKARVKQIRIHDLRHSHVSQLIHMGFSAVAIAERLGHESIDITYRYAHLFPSTQEEMAERLEAENERPSGN
jgi:integrase